MDGIQEIRGNILEQIRQRPLTFLGERTISGLWHFLCGYSLAWSQLGAGPLDLLPEDFHDWVAYRLHFLESTSGWRNMILDRVPDEAKALERFFELLNEHHSRQARTVAIVHCHPQDCKVKQQRKYPDGSFSDWSEITCAKEVRVVIFTDDPGFFIVNDAEGGCWPIGNRFYPSLSWVHTPYKADPDFLEVIDKLIFDRLLHEEVALKEQLRNERETHQRDTR